MSNEGRAYGWDEGPIEKPNEGGEFTVLPAGTYPFKVMKFERGRFEGSAKMGPCPKAIVTVEIDGGEAGSVSRAENLFLHEKCQGILSAFFRAIGHRKHGEPLVMNWSRVIGARGTCKVGVREYDKKDGSGKAQANEVKAWLDPDDTPASTATPDPETAPLPF